MKLKDKKIRILQYIHTTDEEGFGVDVWKPIHSGKIWAYYRHLSGREFFAAAMVNAEEEVIFTVNYRADLDTEMIIEYAGEYFQIERIDDHEGYKTDLDIYCSTYVGAEPDIQE